MRPPSRIRALNHQVAPTAVKWAPSRHSGLLPSVYSQTSLSASRRFRPVINTSSTSQQVHVATSTQPNLGPCVQSPRLQVNQLNQQSLIPAGRDKFIKGLFSVSSCFSQPDHFPRSRVTQRQGYEMFPHPPKEHQRTSHARDQINAVIRSKYIWITH